MDISCGGPAFRTLQAPQFSGVLTFFLSLSLHSFNFLKPVEENRNQTATPAPKPSLGGGRGQSPCQEGRHRPKCCLMALFLKQAKPSGSHLLCGWQRSWGEPPTLPQAHREHPSKHHFIIPPWQAGLRGCHFSSTRQNSAVPSTVPRLASDLPADFFPGLTGWVKRECSREPRHTFSTPSCFSPPTPSPQLLL